MNTTLRINGNDKQFPQDRAPKTLAELLAELKIDQATVVAEIDGRIVERKDFASAALQPGQSIELVRFVGGG
ncbi:MAG: sulfur carrier protein ThiS [Phycisphaerae bacterium]|nr:sulfur carrier protein ThiS [Phycisphaerae bacterium]